MAVKPITPKWVWFIIMCVTGLLVGLTNLSAPLHELAHVTTARNHGIRAEVSGWAETSMESLNRPAILSGWITELIVFSALAFIVAVCAINSPWMTGGFWYGAAVMHWARAFGSSDFTNTLFKSFADEGRALSFSPYRDKLVSSWTWLGIIIFSVVGLVIYLCARKKKARPT